MSWKTSCFFGLAVMTSLCASCGSDDPAGDEPVGPAGGTGNGQEVGPPGITPLTTHPRLLVRDADLARLRGWAVGTNPIFASLDALAKDFAKKMDAGELDKDSGTSTYTASPSESYAELFAFMSLISADQPTRDAYAKRAKTALMRVIDQAVLGVAEGQPYRDKKFSIYDRSRWSGEAFGLTVDWIYGTLTIDEKAKIRTVFLRWADELMNAQMTNHNHPVPVGVVDDPQLTSDKTNVRWAANNYYTSHARNLGLISLSFDKEDDADGKLGAYVKNVTGAWLYVSDAMMRGDMAGGLAAEGFEYGPQATGYVAQLLAALYSSGRADPAIYGEQATFSNPFWDEVIPAYVHSISPDAKTSTDLSYKFLGPLHQVAQYGDNDKTWAADAMPLFGAIGVRDILAKNEKRLGDIRWIETNAPPGGKDRLAARAKDPNDTLPPILYFLLFDPAAAEAADLRPPLPTTYLGKGLGRILARTSWSPDATWFTYKMSWNAIDHQHADGNQFELYRKGEWLTKERTGYGENIISSDYHNTLALENDVPFHNEGLRAIAYTRGSQWPQVSDEGAKLVSSSLAAKFVYALGDATALYNSAYEKSTDIVHTSRSIVWLMPDRVVTYDRATTKTDNRFKRFWLNLPNDGTVSSNLTTMATAGGQKLFVRTLLPASAAITVEPAEPLGDEPADLEPMKFRLRVEAPGGPKNVRFLNVLQGADAATPADSATLVASSSGTSFEGVSVNDVIVMFPVDLGAFASLSYSAPASTKAHLITGLTPGASYNVASVPGGGSVTVTVTPGAGSAADGGGVLVIGQLP